MPSICCSPVPVDQKPHPLTHERSSAGARPSSAAPVQRNSLDWRHDGSFVVARNERAS
jgi:hypothetical protein